MVVEYGSSTSMMKNVGTKQEGSSWYEPRGGKSRLRTNNGITYGQSLEGYPSKSGVATHVMESLGSADYY